MRRSPLSAAVGIIIFVFLLFTANLVRNDGLERLSRQAWDATPAATDGNAPETPTTARCIQAADLLARQPKAHAARIPKIFHQSWKTTELPAKFQNWSRSCQQRHKDWEWVIWTDEDNLKLVQKHFPKLEKVYHDLPGEIYRADVVRAMYMYIYGGVYADLDTECLRPTEELQKQYNVLFDGNNSGVAMDTAVFGRMGDDPHFEHSIPNAWMASTPGHPFFLMFLQTFQGKAKELSRKWWTTHPEHVTGPVALREAIVRYETAKVRSGYRLSDEVATMAGELPFAAPPAKEHQVLLLPSQYIYPYSWGADGKGASSLCWVLSRAFSAEACKEKLEVQRKKSISITYWSHTHTTSGQNKANIKQLEAAR